MYDTARWSSGYETVRGSGGCVGLVGGSSGGGLPSLGLAVVSFFRATGGTMQRAVAEEAGVGVGAGASEKGAGALIETPADFL